MRLKLIDEVHECGSAANACPDCCVVSIAHACNTGSIGVVVFSSAHDYRGALGGTDAATFCAPICRAVCWSLPCNTQPAKTLPCYQTLGALEPGHWSGRCMPQHHSTTHTPLRRPSSASCARTCAHPTSSPWSACRIVADVEAKAQLNCAPGSAATLNREIQEAQPRAAAIFMSRSAGAQAMGAQPLTGCWKAF